MDENVWTRQFGRARVSVISEGTGWWPLERGLEGVPVDQVRELAEVNDQNQMLIGFNLVHVALPRTSILLDTGFGEYDPTDPVKPLVSVRNLRLTGGVEAGLRAIGVSPEAITHVLITHMHGDHIVGATRVTGGERVPTYPNARYYVMRDEWESAPAWHQLAEAIQPQKDALLRAGAVELVDGEREIVPGVTFLPAPGESPGHAIVRIDTGEGNLYYLGDLYHQPAEFLHLDWIPRYRDRAALVSARRTLTPRFAAERAWLIPSHHAFPAIGRVEPREDAGNLPSFRWLPWAEYVPSAEC